MIDPEQKPLITSAVRKMHKLLVKQNTEIKTMCVVLLICAAHKYCELNSKFSNDEFDAALMDLELREMAASPFVAFTRGTN